MTNVLRIGGIALLLGATLLTGCERIDEREKALRELESRGLETQGDLGAFERTLSSLTDDMLGGDSEVTVLLLQAGLLSGPPEVYIERVRDEGEAVAILLREADPVAATYQWREESIRTAADAALVDVSDAYREWVGGECKSEDANRHGLLVHGWPAYRINVCTRVKVESVVNFFERPKAARRQFGAWLHFYDNIREDYRQYILLVIEDVGGGADICMTDVRSSSDYSGSGNRYRHQHLSGTFNDDGVLVLTVQTFFGSTTENALFDDASDELVIDGDRFTRVTSISSGMADLWSRREREH